MQSKIKTPFAARWRVQVFTPTCNGDYLTYETELAACAAFVAAQAACREEGEVSFVSLDFETDFDTWTELEAWRYGGAQ